MYARIASGRCSREAWAFPFRDQTPFAFGFARNAASKYGIASVARPAATRRSPWTEGSHVRGVAPQRLRSRGLRRLHVPDREETRSDFRARLSPFPGAFDWSGLCLQEAERPHVRVCRASIRACVKRRAAGFDEPADLLESAAFSIEQALEESHPCHPIPRTRPRWGRVGQLADMQAG